MAANTILSFIPQNRIPKRPFIYSIFAEPNDQHLVARVYSDGSLLELGRFGSREAAIAFAERLPASGAVS
jgi:hypothetical protein